MYPIYLEIGNKRVFAVSVDWPGWFAHGRDEDSAIQGLLEAGPRYERILESTDLSFVAPADIAEFQILERVNGNRTTDYGAPDMTIPGDEEPIDLQVLEHFQAVLQACWRAFEEAVEGARGEELRKGPRGGGRDIDGIVGHVVAAEISYLKRLGWKVEMPDDAGMHQQMEIVQQGMRDGLVEAAAGNLQAEGPRGGKRWPARYYVRRSGYHITDHIWEIEDRTIE